MGSRNANLKIVKSAKETYAPAKNLDAKRRATKAEKAAARKRRMENPKQTQFRKHGGRRAGTPNRFPRLLKDAILEAAETVGLKLAPYSKRGEHQHGLVNYLCHQAEKHPVAFMGLLARVMPLQIDAGEGPVLIVDRVEYHVVDGRDPNGNELEHELNTAYNPRPALLEGSAETVAVDPPGEIQRSSGR